MENKIILDSCIVTEIQRGNIKIVNEVCNFQQENSFITPIVVAEIFRGARNKSELEKCRKLLHKFRILSLNESVVTTFSELFDRYSLSHRPSEPDMLIAATAIHYDIPLFTLNAKDFQFVPEIKLHAIYFAE